MNVLGMLVLAGRSCPLQKETIKSFPLHHNRSAFAGSKIARIYHVSALWNDISAAVTDPLSRLFKFNRLPIPGNFPL